MSLHITHIPLLYCLLYYRTHSGRARDIFLGSGIIAKDSQSEDTDSLGDFNPRHASYHRDGSSRLESEEVTDWVHVRSSNGNKHEPHGYVRNSILELLPWEKMRRDYEHRRHHRKQHRGFARNNLEDTVRLSSPCESHSAHVNHNGYKLTTHGTASPFLNHAERRDRQHCFLRTETDVRELLPGVFMSHQELGEIVPRPGIKEFSNERLAGVLQHQSHNKPPKLSKMVEFPHTQSSSKSDSQLALTCGACFTEIAYDVFQEITDVNGIVHQVINFNNAFQFIPVGRCKNEFSECGGGQGATCRQVYRAHWSFVFSQQTGAQLVPHEVPSHCECTNLATATVGDTSSGNGKATK